MNVQMKKISVFFGALLVLVSFNANAQNYKTALGAKFYAGDFSQGGINIRHNTSDHYALEGSLLFFSNNIGLEGLYEYQGPINGAPGLQYFVGGGGMLAFGNSKYGRNGRYDDSRTFFALRLTGGLDYKFPQAPINVSLGLDPFFYLTPFTGSSLPLGIGLRYVIK